MLKIRTKKIKRLTFGMERLTAFSDGVFAIAITLLVLDLHVPELPENATNIDQSLGEALLKQLPNFGAYLSSFVVIGIYWLAHHRIFALITRSDRRLAALNLLFLLFISLLPFPTSLISRYSPRGLPETLYAANIALTGLTLALIWFYATSKRRLVAKDLPQDVVMLNFLRSLNTTVVFLLSIVVNYIWPELAAYVWMLLIVTSFIIGRIYVEEEEEEETTVAEKDLELQTQPLAK